MLEQFEGAIKNWRVWVMLAYQDIQLRYRRSTLGPFWITLSMAVTIYTVGFLYGHLFRVNLAEYFPYLAVSLILWTFISTVITESTEGFIEAEHYLRNLKLPYNCFLMRIVLRNLIILAHNILVLIPIVFMFNIPINWNTLLFIPGLAILLINGVLYGGFLAVLGTRFRDFTQIMQSIVPVIFYTTPIMWMPNLLPAKYQWLVTVNPFYQLLNLLRNPLLGQGYTPIGLLLALFVTLLGFVLYSLSMGGYRRRIVFWL